MSADLAPEAEGLLRHVVSSIVENPDAVEIDASNDDDTVRFDVRVGDGDMGRVIGKRGRTAHAIRALVRAAAAKDGTSVDVEFID
ncbi:MAG: KH domain-containing protein [Actinomycetota bacterium]